jgi:2-C-methyl-D-erythritol 2,4-cyclodiphosphate synthase
MSSFRIGLGTDTHRLAPNLPLILGGITLEHDHGCVAHSDGDAVMHALCDALLGAANLRDIGYHFPDNLPENKGKDSAYFLSKVKSLLDQKGYRLVNCDITVQIQTPKINPYIPEMQHKLAHILHSEPDCISIKAKTGEGIGFIGRKEGVSVQCVVLIEKVNG